MGLLHAIFFAVHYLYASQTAQVASLTTAVLGMMLAAGAPPVLCALSMAFLLRLRLLRRGRRDAGRGHHGRVQLPGVRRRRRPLVESHRSLLRPFWDCPPSRDCGGAPRAGAVITCFPPVEPLRRGGLVVLVLGGTRSRNIVTLYRNNFIH